MKIQIQSNFLNRVKVKVLPKQLGNNNPSLHRVRKSIEKDIVDVQYVKVIAGTDAVPNTIAPAPMYPTIQCNLRSAKKPYLP